MATRKKTAESSITDQLSDLGVDSSVKLEKPQTKQVKTGSQVGNLESLKIQTAQQFNNLFDVLIKETDAVEFYKRKTEEELELEKRQFKQEQNESNLNLILNQRKLQAEFDERLSKEKKIFEEEKLRKEETLKVQKENLDRIEEEQKNFKLEFDSFPQKLGKAVETARRDAATELKKDFDAEKKFLAQRNESDIKLLNQQISSLQAQLKQQEKEAQYLREEKTGAMEQVKDMAVAMVGGNKEKENQSQTNI